MKIQSVQLYRVSLPTRRVHRWRTLTESIGSYILLRLTSADGIDGWGEATALGSWGGDHGRHYGEPPAHVWQVLTELVAPVAVGREFVDRHALLAEANSVVRGHPYAKTAFEGALLDLVARSCGVPVYELLGGRRRQRIDIAHSIGLLANDDALAEARQIAGEGFRTVKIKVGEDPERDVALLRALHSELGGKVDLAVDANQGWGDAVQAERVLRRLHDVPLRYVEQPVEGLHQLELLAARVPFPVMADESMWNAYDMAEVARGDMVRLASVYTSKAGGLHNALAADAVATAFGIGTNVNGSGETGVGNLANVHLAACMQSLREGCVVPISRRAEDRGAAVGGAMYTDDVLAESMTVIDGSIVVPDGPGWGIEVDLDKLDSYTTARAEVAV